MVSRWDFFLAGETTSLIDHVSVEHRSAMMQAIRRKGTTPELLVRSAAHKLGLRFRLHRKELPGCPDLVFPKRRTAVFVNGCFWHQHRGCKKARPPKSNSEYWLPKLMRNAARDARNYREMRRQGWRPVVIWECEVGTPDQVRAILCQRVLSLNKNCG